MDFLRHLSQDDIYVLGAAVAAFIAVVTVGSSFIEFDYRTKRLKMLQERRAELRSEAARERRKKHAQGHINFMRQIVNRFELLKSSGVNQVQHSLIEAGWRSKDAMVIYMFMMLVLPFTFGVFGALVMGMEFWQNKPYKDAQYAVPLVMMYIGLKLPMFVVRYQRKKRYLKIKRALSDTLDLLTICAEAGLTLAVALSRVSRELGIAYPEMAEELSLTSLEMGLLPERTQSLINLTKRVALPEVRGIVNVLVQTERYGTPVAQAMRVLSAEFREQRLLAAENKAARLGPLMTIPMICFILPTMFIVVIAPAAIQLMDTFK